MLAPVCASFVSVQFFLLPCSHSASDFNVVAAATSVLERLATIRAGRVQIVSQSVALSLSSLLSHSDSSVRSAAIAALRVASDSIESRRTLAGYDDVAKLMTQSLCALNAAHGALCCAAVQFCVQKRFSDLSHFVSRKLHICPHDIHASHLHPPPPPSQPPAKPAFKPFKR
jgi:hypothetical protein